MSEEHLIQRRESLIAERSRIETEMRETKALIVERNRQPAVSKQTIARLKQKVNRLLSMREKIVKQTGGVNAQIKELRRLRGGQYTIPESFAQRFVDSARRTLDVETFSSIASNAQQVKK